MVPVRVEPREPRLLLKILFGIGGHHAHGIGESRASRTSTVAEDPSGDRWVIRFLGAFDVITRFLYYYFQKVV
jgi:hypothetical protein